ncbi:hypothetical protein LJ739_06905 [Aestuariibacter halophilus]|uniref:Uncharacterized protein n=1 Tax=Fluctibacter halophilus TaxID=226011 RepID=A0ABS8G7B8_9ALTE|nr:hypothetical protein [Aestuariibacter halophilus]MCC2615966.1 hypothetical protein [Aestuariibacter halophilus]
MSNLAENNYSPSLVATALVDNMTRPRNGLLVDAENDKTGNAGVITLKGGVTLVFSDCLDADLTYVKEICGRDGQSLCGDPSWQFLLDSEDWQQAMCALWQQHVADLRGSDELAMAEDAYMESIPY